MALSESNMRRYARHIILPEIGGAGQEQLLHAKILVIGVGGLGSVAAGYLAAMGVGIIGLVDADRVELSNLQRQILFETADIGQHKAIAAATRLNEMNPEIKIFPHMERFDHGSAMRLIESYDIVVDATDNFATRLCIHDECFKTRKTLVTAAISGFEAMITCFKHDQNTAMPCAYCFMPEIPEREMSCAQEGIVGALAGVIGSIQALETVKEILNIGESLQGKLLRFDALKSQWQTSTLSRDPECVFCGDKREHKSS